MDHELYMAQALKLAGEAARAGEVPVGCLIVDGQGQILGSGRNRRQELRDATAHAEILAIRQACAALGDWRLEGCTMYVSLEPCPMCAGAIINSRLPLVVYGAREPLSGCCGSVLDLFWEGFGHRPQILGGVLEDEASALLRSFFQGKRR